MRKVPITKLTLSRKFKDIINTFKGKSEFDRANELIDFIIKNENNIHVEKQIQSTSFNVSKEKAHQLKEIAKEHNMTVSTYVNKYIEEYYKEYRHK